MTEVLLNGVAMGSDVPVLYEIPDFLATVSGGCQVLVYFLLCPSLHHVSRSNSCVDSDRDAKRVRPTP